MIYKVENGQETVLAETNPNDGLKSIYKYSDTVHYAYLDVIVKPETLHSVTTYQFAVNGRNGDCGILGLGVTDAYTFVDSWCIWLRKNYLQEIMGIKKITDTHWRILFKSRNYTYMGSPRCFKV